MSRRIARSAAAVVAALFGLGGLVALVSSSDDDSNHSAGGDDSSAAPAAAESTTAAEASAAARSAGGYEYKSEALKNTSRTSDEAAASPPAPEAAATPAARAPNASGAAVLPALGPDAAALGGAPVPGVVPAAAAPGRIIKTAVLSLDVPKGKLATSFDRLVMIAAEAGGYVQSADKGQDQGSLVLKVPVQNLEPVLTQIGTVGKTKSQSISGEDVSEEFVDLDARARHWRAQEAVFLDLMTRAKTIPDTIQIQQQLSSIQSQIEQIEGRRRFLDSQTAYSTVRLTILETGAVAKEPKPADEQSVLGRAWDDATGVFLEVLGGTLVVLGVALPLVLVGGVPALVFFAYRRRQGRIQDGVAPAG